MQCIPSLIYSWLSAITAIVELHNVQRSALSRVIKEFITRDKVPRNTSWEIMFFAHLFFALKAKRQSRARTFDCIALDLWSLLPVHGY